jgi:hypothetical protein
MCLEVLEICSGIRVPKFSRESRFFVEVLAARGLQIVRNWEYCGVAPRSFVGLIGPLAPYTKSHCFSCELLQEHKCLDLTHGN